MTTQNKIKMIPRLRFPGFFGEWGYKKMSELLSESKKRNFQLEFGKNEVLSVSGESGIINQIKHLGRSYAGESVCNYHVVENGDIVYTKSPLKANPYGIIRLNNGIAGIVSTLYAVYSVKNKNAFGLFLDQYFSSNSNTNRYLRPLVKKGAKNDMKINNDYVLHDRIFVPDVLEQQKIASFLGSVDEWLENLRAQKEYLEKYKKGMMQRIFSQEIRFKDEDGNDFPEWEEKKLSEIGKTYNGLSGKSGEDFGEGEPFVTYKQIFDSSQIDIEKYSLVKVGIKEKQNKANFGDVFFTTSSETPLEVGFASVLLDKSAAPYLNSFSFGFRSDSTKILNPYFAKFFFRCAIFRREVVKLAQGSTRYNISKIGFMKIKIYLPSFPEQKKIAKFLTSLDNLIESKRQQIPLAKQWKKGLMQGLFI